MRSNHLEGTVPPTYRVTIGEDEAEAIDLIEVQRIAVQDLNVNLPFSEVIRLDKINAWGKF